MLERTVSAIAKLTQKQSRFVDEYLIDLNETQAAIRAGYSRKTAHAIGSENLKKPEIKKQIDSRLQEIKSARTADATEVLETLTAILRGEMTEQVPLLCGDGCQELADKNTAVKDRLKAAELLGKRYRLFDDDGSGAAAGAIASFIRALRTPPDEVAALFAQEQDHGGTA